MAQYQHDALDYLNEHDEAYLFITMGGRKTQIAIAHCEINAFPRVLVVCLNDNIKTWKDELNRWVPNHSATLVRGDNIRKIKKIKKYIAEDQRYLIIGYDAVKKSAVYAKDQPEGAPRIKIKENRKIEYLLTKHAKEFDIVIFDEVFEVGNHKSERSKALQKITRDIPRRVGMDGDPTAEGEQRLFGIYRMVDLGKTFGWNVSEFENKYYYWSEDRGFGQFLLKWDAEKRINIQVQRTAFIFTEKDLGKQIKLPEEIYVSWHPEMGREQARIYKELKEDFFTMIDNEEITVEWAIAQSSKMQQVLGGFIYIDGKPKKIKGCKEELLKRLFRKQFKDKKKIVIWCAFRFEVEIIAEVCKQAKRTFVKYQGGMTNKQKDKAKDDFLNDTHEVFIGNIGCGIGLNELVVSHTAIYYSVTERRRHRAQSEKRTNRSSQAHPWVIKGDIIIPKTLDATKIKRLMNKKRKSDRLLNHKTLNYVKGL